MSTQVSCWVGVYACLCCVLVLCCVVCVCVCERERERERERVHIKSFMFRLLHFHSAVEAALAASERDHLQVWAGEHEPADRLPDLLFPSRGPSRHFPARRSFSVEIIHIKESGLQGNDVTAHGHPARSSSATTRVRWPRAIFVASLLDTL